MATAGPERSALMTQIQPWLGCLVQVLDYRALDYLKEMRIKPQDIKPSNISSITDFGIAHDLLYAYTTGSSDTVGLYTLLYCASKALFELGRRGHAADIFSVGCVFIEISTCKASNLGLRVLKAGCSGKDE